MSWQNSFTVEEANRWAELSNRINSIADTLKKRQKKTGRCFRLKSLGMELSPAQLERVKNVYNLSAERRKLRRERHAIMTKVHERWNSEKNTKVAML